jgi:hypothetical protein
MANTIWATVAVLLWLLELLVWWTLIPLVVRPLGIRLPLWRYPNGAAQALGRWQYFIVKVLEVSVGFWLLNTTTDYIACRFEHHTASCKTVGFLFVELAEYMFIAGLLFGLIGWMRRWRRSLASPD